MVAIGAKAFALLEEGKKRKEENEEEQMMNKGSKMGACSILAYAAAFLIGASLVALLIHQSAIELSLHPWLQTSRLMTLCD